MTGQFPDKLAGPGIGRPSMFACASATNHQFRMVAAFPVQQQVDLPAPDRRGDLHEHCTQDTLAQRRCCPVMVPGPLQVVAQDKPGFAFFRCQFLCLACTLKRLQPRFARLYPGKAVLPFAGQIVEHVMVAGINRIELRLGTVRLATGFRER